jgi:hypothetical protein
MYIITLSILNYKNYVIIDVCVTCNIYPHLCIAFNTVVGRNFRYLNVMRIRTNAVTANILRHIAYLEMEDNDSSIVFKSRSYNKASGVIANSASVYTKQGLKGFMQIPLLLRNLQMCNTILEIMTIQKNGKLLINSYAHHSVHFAFLKLGIGQDRRHWAEKSDILITFISS